MSDLEYIQQKQRFIELMIDECEGDIDALSQYLNPLTNELTEKGNVAFIMWSITLDYLSRS